MTQTADRGAHLVTTPVAAAFDLLVADTYATALPAGTSSLIAARPAEVLFFGLVTITIAIMGQLCRTAATLTATLADVSTLRQPQTVRHSRTSGPS